MAKESKKTLVHRPKRRPSLRDLAEKIGVSHTAVARALRDDPNLSEELRKRVQKVARDEGYLFSDITQTLITGKSGTIGVIVPSLVSSFVSSIVAGISDALWEDRTSPLILSSNLDAKREELMLETLATKRVSGLLIMPCQADRDEDHFVHLVKQHTPIVSIDNLMVNVQAPLIASNDLLGGELVTKHLLSKGHENILHIGVSDEMGQVDHSRENAYVKVMGEAGLQPHVMRLPHRRVATKDVLPLLQTWFDSKAGAKTTAIFAYNDAAAFCVYEFARKRGIAIGKDIALVGYGNTRLAVSSPDAYDLISPPLTSVEQHPRTLGKMAVEILSQMIEGKPVAKETYIEPSLIVRESCGK